MSLATKWSNQRRRGRNDYAGRSGAPLSREQKAALCILCREAYAVVMCGEACLPSLDDWRHEQVALACGKPGLTACTSGDYRAIQARFLDLKGETGAALNAHVAHQTEDVSLARHKLAEALAARKLPPAYAAAIGRSRFKRELHELNARQVWQLVFTINNRNK